MLMLQWCMSTAIPLSLTILRISKAVRCLVNAMIEQGSKQKLTDVADPPQSTLQSDLHLLVGLAYSPAGELHQRQDEHARRIPGG